MLENLNNVLQRIEAIEERFNPQSAPQASGASSDFAQVLQRSVDSTATTGTSNGTNPGPALDALIEKTAANEGLDPNLLRGVVRQESGFNPNAVSPVGAQGLMQLMPDTARGLGVQNPFDPAQNLAGGSHYLKGLLQKYHSVPMALAAYNAGPGAVDKYGGVPPYRETQNYVKNILSNL